MGDRWLSIEVELERNVAEVHVDGQHVATVRTGVVDGELQLEVPGNPRALTRTRVQLDTGARAVELPVPLDIGTPEGLAEWRARNAAQRLDDEAEVLDLLARYERVFAANEALALAVWNGEAGPCSRCGGKGYHHGFGEGGHDPDWCAECGGAG